MNLYQVISMNLKNISNLGKNQINNTLGNFYYFLSDKSEALNFVSKNQHYYLESFTKNDNLLRQRGYHFIIHKLSSNSRGLIVPSLKQHKYHKVFSVIPSRENLPSFWLSRLCKKVPLVVLSMSKKRYNGLRLAEINCALESSNKKDLQRQTNQMIQDFSTFRFKNNQAKDIPHPISSKKNVKDFFRGAFQANTYDLCGSFMFDNKQGFGSVIPTWYNFSISRFYRTLSYYQKPSLAHTARWLRHL